MSATQLAFKDETEFLFVLWWNTPIDQRDREFSTPKEVAPKLGIGEAHVRNKADQGTLPGAIKPCGRWVIHIPTLIKSLKRRKP